MVARESSFPRLIINPNSHMSHSHNLQAKEIGTRYKSISEDEKAKWQAKADAAKEVYKKEFAEYEITKPKKEEEKETKKPKADSKKKKKKQPEPEPESSDDSDSDDDSDDSDSDSD